ncbi:hypothetical protein RhiirA4_488390 [Rhizophagus irregularis]|uniref:Uncharacterized protein n=1 Tax=Rhizophagus irregularis TaxID=588596 RepID=A0A2I1HTM6_9GLOM|nr:hypothetical protein RhiirA4_488390 [Rhizophagus irregularis]
MSFCTNSTNLIYWAETRKGSRNSIYYSIDQNEVLARVNFGISRRIKLSEF